MIHPLGRRKPLDRKHINKYPLKALGGTAPVKVEKRIKLPYWHWSHDQGSEGACVGFALSMMMAMLNENQARSKKTPPYVHKYNSRWLWNEAKKIDEWPETQPDDNNGTSVRAGCDVLRDIGHQLIRRRINYDADLTQGINTNRWARTVDEIRDAISMGIPVVLGIDWHANFDKPIPKKVGKLTEHWIGEGDLGMIRGGHAICLYGASDRRKAFALKNSWGRDYPLVWIPYSVVAELIKPSRMGEACLVTDR